MKNNYKNFLITISLPLRIAIGFQKSLYLMENISPLPDSHLAMYCFGELIIYAMIFQFSPLHQAKAILLGQQTFPISALLIIILSLWFVMIMQT